MARIFRYGEESKSPSTFGSLVHKENTYTGRLILGFVGVGKIWPNGGVVKWSGFWDFRRMFGYLPLSATFVDSSHPTCQEPFVYFAVYIAGDLPFVPFLSHYRIIGHRCIESEVAFMSRYWKVFG